MTRRKHYYDVYDREIGKIVNTNVTREFICYEYSLCKSSFQNYANGKHYIHGRYIVRKVDEEPLYNIYSLVGENLTLNEAIKKSGISYTALYDNVDKKPIHVAGIYIERVK